MPGVTVSVRNIETGVERTVVSDEDGRYRASNLGPGEYLVTATLEGFKTEIRSGISLTIGREARVDLTLTVGGINEQVSVQAEVPLVDATNAVTSSLVDQRQIENLPLNGRDLTQLTLLTAGVVPSRGAAARASNGFGTKLSIAGGRPQVQQLPARRHRY